MKIQMRDKTVKIGLSLCGVLVFATGALGMPTSPDHVVLEGWNFDVQDVGDTRSTDCDDIVTADFDGDGDLDFALTEDPYISWYENDGANPPAWTMHTVTSDGGYMGMTAGDFDGDDDWDIAAGHKGSGNHTYWFENDGDGGGWDKHQLPVSGDFIDNMRAHDYNGDGRDDLIIEQYGNDPVYYAPSPANPKGAWSSYQIGAGAGLSLGDVDEDGDMDVVTGGKVYLCPENPAQINWPLLVSDPPPGASFDKSAVGDVDRDGEPDILFSEGEGTQVVVYFGPDWSRSQTVFTGNNGMHTLQFVDLDADGDLDVFAGEIHGSGRTFAFENADGDGTSWTPHEMAGGDPDGTHNGWVGDMNGDGRPDLLGKHYSGGQITVWYNTLKWSLDHWHYISVTTNHAQTFGLAFGQVDDDTNVDIVSGRYWYANPGGDMTSTWTQSAAFPNDIHAVLFVDVDDDAMTDMIGIDGANVYWLEAANANGSSWNTVSVGSVPAASHSLGAQGFKVADIEAGAKFEIVMTSGNGIYYFRIPADPTGGNWPQVHVNANPTDEGFGVGYINDDEHLDLAAGTGSPDNVEWYLNPGDGSGNWTAYPVGNMNGAVWTDRFEIADIDGDRNPDIIGTEENGGESGAEAYWWEQPDDLFGETWTRHQITSRASLNSMGVADMNHDGTVDVILGEHRGGERVSVFENDGDGNFTEHEVSTGRESHLSARPVDLDGDGDLDIVSIAWDESDLVHLWRNDGGGTSSVDTEPPAIAAVAALNANEVRIVFDDVVEQGSAETVGNYAIDNGVSISSATLEADGKTVTLGISLLTEDVLYTLTVTGVRDLSGNPASDSATFRLVSFPSEGLVAWWQLDESDGTTAQDSWASNHGTLTNGPVWQPGGGKIGGALAFDGVDDLVAVGNMDVAGGNGLTIAFWFKADDFDNADARFVSKATDSSEQGHYWMVSAFNGSALRFRLKAGGSTDTLMSGSGVIQAGEWVHVAATFDGAAMRIYMGGTAVASVDKTGNMATGTNVPAALGAQPQGGNEFDGLLDDVRIYNRALSQAEIGLLINPPATILTLHGVPGDRLVHLTWDVAGGMLPVTSTWQIGYQSETGTVLTPSLSIPTYTVRNHTLTGLTNGVWYTVTLDAVVSGSVGTLVFLSDSVHVMPTDIFVCLPLVLRSAQQ
ncbi:MAG: hypothetical protein GY832_42630 [Chloroflexi bacterium]|nr:hypothetical protein [Chloroflexota bacterium]